MEQFPKIPYDYFAETYFQPITERLGRIEYKNDIINIPNPRSLQDIAKEVRRTTDDLSPGYFNVYSEYTSGSHGEPTECVRPSLSQLLEFQRLRDLLHIAARLHAAPPCKKIYYYSRYGVTTYSYEDHQGEVLNVMKYNEEQAQALYNHLEKEQEAFVLSGSPSSINDLLDMGFSKFAPALLLLSGEHCPLDVEQRFKLFSNRVMDIYVAREFGLLGFRCPHLDRIHLFANHFEFKLSKKGEILVSDPTNYAMNYYVHQTGDYASRIEHRACGCGVHSLSVENFRGREYAKPYPAL